uniref:Uncharacterized protein n=1 Tax=Arundo donax TaxID=35708 RepID=A0A0A9AN89_ARUDO
MLKWKHKNQHAQTHSNWLMDYYSKNGGFLDSRKVSDDMTSWDIIPGTRPQLQWCDEVAGMRRSFRLFDRIPYKKGDIEITKTSTLMSWSS